MTEPIVPCALCVKYRAQPIMVSATKHRHKSGYPLCSECASFLNGMDGYEPCCGPHGRGCPRGVTPPAPGGKRCPSCLEAFKSLHSGR
jgi:hypothetical protein